MLPCNQNMIQHADQLSDARGDDFDRALPEPCQSRLKHLMAAVQPKYDLSPRT